MSRCKLCCKRIYTRYPWNLIGFCWLCWLRFTDRCFKEANRVSQNSH